MNHPVFYYAYTYYNQTIIVKWNYVIILIHSLAQTYINWKKHVHFKQIYDYWLV